MNIVLLGPPGAGKGTQAKALCLSLGLAHLSTGDLLRDAIRAGTELGILAMNLIDGGNYVPDEVVRDMVLERIDVPGGGFVFDGFPRTIAQAGMLEAALISRGRVVSLAVELRVDEEALLKRIMGRAEAALSAGDAARPDDDPLILGTRLTNYRRMSTGIGRWYEDRGLLVSVDGMLPVQEVTGSIMEHVGRLADGRLSQACA